MEAGGLIVQIFHTNIHLLNLLLCPSPEKFCLTDLRGFRILFTAWGNNQTFLWDMPGFCADIADIVAPMCLGDEYSMLQKW